ncbi:TARBP2 family protein [Megaselia abdita]
MPENIDSSDTKSCQPLARNGSGYAPRKIRGSSKSSQKINNIQEKNESSVNILESSLTSTGNSTSSSLASTVKTPVSILQELLSRRGITPSYELVQIEGAIHEPTFRYRVSFSDKEIPLTAMGSGRSKKEAKHAAAKALIDKLTGVTIIDKTTALNENKLDNIEDNVVGNPIGWLQELCMSRRWPPPIYETEMEVGLPHERQFTIACTIGKYREVGQGKSKKIAKRLAAHKMWNRLQTTPIENVLATSNTNNFDDDIEQYRFFMSRYGDVKDSSVQTINNSYSQKVAQFHKTLKNSKGTKLGDLQNVCLKDQNLDPAKFLEEISQEQQFEVTYVDIEEKSYSNLSQCLVQLSTLPVAVCHGVGTNAQEAQTDAAVNALEYLKIMTKK